MIQRIIDIIRMYRLLSTIDRGAQSLIYCFRHLLEFLLNTQPTHALKHNPWHGPGSANGDPANKLLSVTSHSCV